MVTVGVLCGLGDGASQGIEQQLAKRNNATPHAYDVARTGRVALFGFGLSGWMSHFWILALERVAPGSSMGATLVKMGLDQTVFAPVILTAFFGSLSIMEGKTVQQAKDTISAMFWPSMKLNWMFWPIAQTINFRLVPIQHRVGFVSVCLCFWNCVLSYVHHTSEH